DVWGTGIARQSLLECGRRLVAAGRLERAEQAVDASLEELAEMLRGSGGPSSELLKEREHWRRHASLDDVPPILGPEPTPPPPLDGLPPHAAMAMIAFGSALDELFTPAPESTGATILGKPVSPGVYRGRARIVAKPSDMNLVKQGDVLITASTSPAFNVVLPLLGAVVTDRGGQLSHAAIIAREYGIPAVVGTLRATSTIPDGAMVEVDGTTGRVRVL
ncbi:MAG: PEP-utilizing enzyme, partial [Candidatus Eisenbacteria bacterium]